MLRRNRVIKRECFGFLILQTLGLESSAHTLTEGKRSQFHKPLARIDSRHSDRAEQRRIDAVLRGECSAQVFITKGR